MSLFKIFTSCGEKPPRYREENLPRTHGITTATRGSVNARLLPRLTPERLAEMRRNGDEGIEMMRAEVREEERQRNNS